MNRTTRARQAEETVEILEQGFYRTASGRLVEIAGPVRACLEATRIHPPGELAALLGTTLDRPSPGHATAFEVVDETTLSGIARMVATGDGPVAALNFASARNPGGGFLNGSHAQEESLARSSALYASQLRAPDFYERHRSSPSLLYSDAMIVSPDCPILRDDGGTLLDAPHLATLITAAAPNAGAIADKRPAERPSIPGVLHHRAGLVLALAASCGHSQLVLGAWGCGVFRNDPLMVANSFAAHLRNGPWSGRFARVVFSVLDRSPSRSTFAAFRAAFD